MSVSDHLEGSSRACSTEEHKSSQGFLYRSCVTGQCQGRELHSLITQKKSPPQNCGYSLNSLVMEGNLSNENFKKVVLSCIYTIFVYDAEYLFVDFDSRSSQVKYKSFISKNVSRIGILILSNFEKWIFVIIIFNSIYGISKNETCKSDLAKPMGL